MGDYPDVFYASVFIHGRNTILFAFFDYGTSPMSFSKAEVRYQTQPKHGKHCSICAMYQKPNRCVDSEGKTYVKGFIHPMGWCVKWVKPESARDKRLADAAL